MDNRAGKNRSLGIVPGGAREKHIHGSRADRDSRTPRRAEGSTGECRSQSRPRTRTIAVVSGKGGVGKTTLVANLAVALHREGHRVLVVDGDLGMANVDLLFGLVPRYTLHDVVLGERSPSEVLITTEDGIRILPGASGIEEMADLDDLRCERLLRSVSEVEEGMDLILIDTAPGLHRSTVHLARAADEVVVVTTPEPTAGADAYAMVRALRNGAEAPWLVVNQANDSYEARATAERIRETSRRFLAREPQYLGYIVSDPAVGSAVRRQSPVVRLFPSCPASSCIEVLAQRLITPPDPQEVVPFDQERRRQGNRDYECGYRARA